MSQRLAVKASGVPAFGLAATVAHQSRGGISPYKKGLAISETARERARFASDCGESFPKQPGEARPNLASFGKYAIARRVGGRDAAIS